MVLVLLDAGLRLGEALGLRWGAIAWGADDGDRGRALVIDRSRARGKVEGPPKSGRGRRVALSRRLRLALAELYREQFEPGPEALVLGEFDPGNFRRRPWRRILKRAQLDSRALKDLRDTFASQLLSAGVQLGYVSQQLGHADVAVTARHW
jgi:integrase